MTAQRVRSLVKNVADAIAFVVVSPLIALYLVHVQLAGRNSDTAIQGYAQLLSMVAGRVGVVLRRAFYRVALDRCPGECSIGFGTIMVTPRISLGDGTYIGVYCNVSHCTIGRDTLLGSYVHIIAGKQMHFSDRLDIPIRHQGGKITPVSIGTDVWIGNGALVMADVGDHSIVGAGAVVIRPVPAFSIVGGNPARVIGSRLGGQAAAAEVESRDVPV